MYTFARFPDLGAFSNIIQSHPKFENVPSGLIRDKDGMVLGHVLAPLGTRRFKTFRGAEGETFAIPPPPPQPILPPVSEILNPEIDLSKMDFPIDLEESILGEFGASMSAIDSIYEKVESKKRASSKEVKKTKRRTSKVALKKAAAAGIKASQKGDVETAKRVTERKALAAGASKILANNLAKEVGKAIKKHVTMEQNEVAGIVKKTQIEQPSGRVHELAGYTNAKMKERLKMFGVAAPSKLKNKEMILIMMKGISTVSGVPMKELMQTSKNSASFDRAKKAVKILK